MMRSFYFVPALALAALSCHEKEPKPEVPQGPVEWSVAASADKSQVQVGEDLTLTVTVRHPAGGNPMGPPQKAFEPFEVIGQTEQETSPAETRFEYRMAAFHLPGDLQIPALQFVHRTADKKIGVLKTDPIPVRVATSLSPDVKDIHDIKSPVDLPVPRDLRLLWWLLGALVAAALAYLLYRKLRKEPEALEAAPALPPPPADVEAEAALRQLEEKKLLEKGEILAFYTELSEIVKRYAGRRFDVPYLERTTDEVLFDLKAKRVASDVFADVRELLSASDLVKFARSTPGPVQAAAALDLARTLIEKTRLTPPAAPATEGAKATEEVTA